jgi:serine phosphatase RsbU (regulator of sigma subunit)
MLNRFLRLGIRPDLSFQQQNKLRVFNTACFLVLVICLFYLVFGLVSEFYWAVLVSAFFISSILISSVLVWYRKYNFAFHLALICGFIFVSAFTLLFGAQSKSYFYFLFMPVATTILFDSMKIMVKYMVVSAIFLVTNVAVVEHLPSYYDVSGLWYFWYPNMVFTVLLIFMGLRVFKSENQNYASLIEQQKYKLQEKNQEMTDSINYARRIQYTLLAHTDVLAANLPEHFVLFKPKDIVSGDFYWAARKNSLFYLAVCDSTGHGVPGAFMSLLNISFLNEALNEKNITEPHLVLNHVRKRLIEHISQEGAKDGMDAILICYDHDQQLLSYAAANNAPLLIRHNEIQNLPKDKMPVGQGERIEDFTLHTLNLRAGDSLYLVTDGYADQFGGPLGKKLKSRQLEKLLLAHHRQPAAKQEELLQREFLEWKGHLEQVDDVCIIGIKF